MKKRFGPAYCSLKSGNWYFEIKTAPTLVLGPTGDLGLELRRGCRLVPTQLEVIEVNGMARKMSRTRIN